MMKTAELFSRHIAATVKFLVAGAGVGKNIESITSGASYDMFQMDMKQETIN